MNISRVVDGVTVTVEITTSYRVPPEMNPLDFVIGRSLYWTDAEQDAKDALDELDRVCDVIRAALDSRKGSAL